MNTSLYITVLRREAGAADGSDKDRLQGTWVAMNGENHGAPLQPDQLKRLTVVFERDIIRITKINGLEDKGTFKLDPTRDPKAIDMTFTEANPGDIFGVKGVMHGIYRLEGNRLTLCIADVDELRPGRFESNPDDRRNPLVVVLRRADPATEGWVPLFNGKDLTGWKPHEKQAGTWNVVNGVLVGSKGPGQLFSERGDYANFHLRMEAAVGKGSDANVCFRTAMASPTPPGAHRHPSGYAVDINEGRDAYTGPISFLNPETKSWTTYGCTSVVKPDEWFTLEIFVEGNHLVTKVNGVTAVDFREPLDAFKKGHLALKIWHADTVVKLRKIEIKEMPPGSDAAK
jgi:uncharacterized protein (TIGR03067 family)